MYVIEDFKAILRHSDKMNECIEVAMKIQNAPITKQSSEDLAEVLGMIQRMSNTSASRWRKELLWKKK